MFDQEADFTVCWDLFSYLIPRSVFFASGYTVLKKTILML